MNHFDKHQTAWVPTYSGGTLDGIVFTKSNNKVTMELSADQRATMHTSDRSLKRLQNLIGDMIEFNNRTQ